MNKYPWVPVPDIPMVRQHRVSDQPPTDIP